MRYGYVLEWRAHEHLVNDTTSWGKTVIEGIYLGADWSLKGQAMEYAAAPPASAFTAGVPEAAWPWGDTTAFAASSVSTTFRVALKNVGQRFTEAAGQLVLTAASGTTAASSPATLTAARAVNRRGSFNFDSKNRECLLDFLLLPYIPPDQYSDFIAFETSLDAVSVAPGGIIEFEVGDASLFTLTGGSATFLGFEGGGSLAIDFTYQIADFAANKLFGIATADLGNLLIAVQQNLADGLDIRIVVYDTESESFGARWFTTT